MPQQLLKEYFELPPINEGKQLSNGKLVFENIILARADTLNQNGRIYPKRILEREFKNYMTAIKERWSVGELDHIDSSVVQLKNVSHVVTEARWDTQDGSVVRGNIEVLNTPNGKLLQNLYNEGIKLGISSRGVGSLISEGSNLVVQDDFKLIALDVVSCPSTSGAWLSVVSEGLNIIDSGGNLNDNEKFLQTLNEFLKK